MSSEAAILAAPLESQPRLTTAHQRRAQQPQNIDKWLRAPVQGRNQQPRNILLMSAFSLRVRLIERAIDMPSATRWLSRGRPEVWPALNSPEHGRPYFNAWKVSIPADWDFKIISGAGISRRPDPGPSWPSFERKPGEQTFGPIQGGPPLCGHLADIPFSYLRACTRATWPPSRWCSSHDLTSHHVQNSPERMVFDEFVVLIRVTRRPEERVVAI